MSDESVEGAAAEVLADFRNGKVVARFLHPATDEMVMEIHVDPEVARDFAFQLTKASIAIEEHDLPHP